MNFTTIIQTDLREETKKAVYEHLHHEAIATISKEMTAIRRLSKYLKEKYPDIHSAEELDRELLEEYLTYLATEAEGVNNYRMDLTRLRGILETIGKLYGYPHLESLFLTSDFPKQVQPKLKSYSDSELIRFNAVLAELDEQIERLMVIHQMLGTRISDTLTLQRDCLYRQNGHPMIQIRQMKTNTFVKPISAELELLIEKAIEYTEKMYGDTIYIFVDEKNTRKPLQYNTVQNRVMDIIQKKDLRDDNGELFGFGTHMFRHVYGIRLTEMHLDDWTIAKLLGHTSVKNVKFYRIETLGIVFTNVSIANVSEEILRYVFENQCYELNDTMIRRIVEFENDTMLSGLDTRNYTTIISLGYEPLIKYIQENLKQYVKEIILAPNNTKEDVEQIMDLLERMLENAPEETEICLELVNHEEFCVDDISECCGKFDSDFDKDVKILWDELLDKGKVSLKWENIKCYWDRYKITPELLQYIETNSDQLTFLENQCLNEVFAEELITSTIDDSAFEKLLPQLELEFDIPIEKVERQKVGILIKKKYIPFDVNKYGEIKDAYPDLCPDFILYNQAEYMEVMEKIPMGETLLETLLLSPILDFSNAEVLLDAFGENYMTAKIAENLVDSNVTINKSIFTAAWEYVDEKGKKTLMFKCLSILEAADFENCFSELSQWYSGFCDRSKKHSVELPNNEESQRLAKRLQEVSYITSYKLQEKEVYDSVTETKKKKSTFVCWIKAIKG